MQGAQGTQQDVLHPGIAADGVEHVPALRHGTLPHDLARGQQARADALHVKAGMAQEQDLAVHAGVHDLAEAVGRAGTQHGAKIVAHVQGADVQPVEVAPALHGAGITEEGGMAVQAADPQALFLQDLGRQDAVQAAGKKHDHIHRPLVSIDHAGRGGGLEIGGSVHHGPPSTRKRGQEARARPGFSQLLDRFFSFCRLCGPRAGMGTLLRSRTRAASPAAAPLSRRMGLPFDGADRRPVRPLRRACTASGPGAGYGTGSRSSAPHSCRRTAGPSPLDNY